MSWGCIIDYNIYISLIRSKLISEQPTQPVQLIRKTPQNQAVSPFMKCYAISWGLYGISWALCRISWGYNLLYNCKYPPIAVEYMEDMTRYSHVVMYIIYYYYVIYIYVHGSS